MANYTRGYNDIIADIIAYFEDDPDVFVEAIEDLDNYNGYLDNDRYYSMEELDEIHHDTTPTELLRMAYHGWDEDNCTIDDCGGKRYDAFDPHCAYYRYNGYGNLVSANHKDYSDYLTPYTIETMRNNRRYIDVIRIYSDLTELFDELEDEMEGENNA